MEVRGLLRDTYEEGALTFSEEGLEKLFYM
jgi:hypothetical protein